LDPADHRVVLNLTIQEVSLYSHLVEVLCFFVRQHAMRSKWFLLKENLAARIAQLLACPEKHLKLTALKFFRTCIGLHDSFHNRQIISNKLFDPILDIVFETMPRDNLLNSACLELFEFIKRENMKDLTVHLVEQYRDRLEQITYVDTFRQVIDKYEKYVAPPPESLSFTSVETEATNNRGMVVNGGRGWQGLKDTDAEEEAYFNGPDDEDDDHFSSVLKPITNGASPLKPLVDYPEEDDDDQMDILAQDTSPDQPRETIESPTPNGKQAIPPSERLPEKRRREEDEEDELTKLTTQTKRRSSSISSAGSAVSTHGQTLRRKKSINSGKDGPPPKISIALAVKSGNASADAE
jgi:protein phosphatase-4 regulatory subunit 3